MYSDSVISRFIMHHFVMVKVATTSIRVNSHFKILPISNVGYIYLLNIALIVNHYCSNSIVIFRIAQLKDLFVAYMGDYYKPVGIGKVPGKPPPYPGSLENLIICLKLVKLKLATVISYRNSHRFDMNLSFEYYPTSFMIGQQR